MKFYISIKKEKGFTLVETVIAMLIATIILAGFLQVCNSSAWLLLSTKYRTRAINIAQAEIEDLKALTYDGIDVVAFTPYRADNIIIDEGPTSSPSDDVIGEMRTTVRNVINPPYDGKKIAVEVRWNMWGQPKQDILETVVYSHR